MLQYHVDFLKEGGSIGRPRRPPLLDGMNYKHWKARMCAFIKSIDEKAWKSILVGCSSPTKVDMEGKTIMKSEVEGQARKTS